MFTRQYDHRAYTTADTFCLLGSFGLVLRLLLVGDISVMGCSGPSSSPTDGAGFPFACRLRLLDVVLSAFVTVSLVEALLSPGLDLADLLRPHRGWTEGASDVAGVS
jgi:hypothetical protein